MVKWVFCFSFEKARNGMICTIDYPKGVVVEPEVPTVNTAEVAAVMKIWYVVFLFDMRFFKCSRFFK